MMMHKKAILVLALSAGLAHGQVRAPAPLGESPGFAPGGTPQTAPANQALYEIMGRLDRLQGEIRQLRGQVEEQGYAIEMLKKSQKDMYLDLDHRLQHQAPASDDEPPVGESDDFESRDGPDAAPLTRVPGTPEEREAYRAAYDTLQSGRHGEAIDLLRSFLASHPNGEYADNAHYWLGEAFYASRDFASAREAFGKVLSLFPDSSKLPDAMLKLGYIDYEQARWNDARDRLSRLISTYPDSTAARLAQTRLARMDQEKR